MAFHDHLWLPGDGTALGAPLPSFGSTFIHEFEQFVT
jgi:hypothetical protein